MRSRIVGLALGALLQSACASATSHASRPLEIRSDGEGVFGCLPSDEDDVVEVADAGVSAALLRSGPLSSDWSISLEPGKAPVRLAPGECLAYGFTPSGYSASAPTSQLQSAILYSFHIRSPQWGKYRTRNHFGIFCLRRSEVGLQVVSVPRGPATVTAETCARLLDAANPASELKR